MAAPARADWPRVDAGRDLYRRVQVEGRFLHERETLVLAVTERGPGFWLLTPLRQSDGSLVLINRGFLPGERSDPQARRAGAVDGPVRVTGLMRMSEPGGGFLRANDPVADRWYSRDVAAIAAARGLEDVAPYFIDADASPNAGGLPIGGLTVVRFPNNHLVYALTWYALALMLAGACLRLARRSEAEDRTPSG